MDAVKLQARCAWLRLLLAFSLHYTPVDLHATASLLDCLLDKGGVLYTRVTTPCIGICSTALGDSVCRGCKRFNHEVIAWNGYREEEKLAIDQRLGMLLDQLMRERVHIHDAERLRAQLQAHAVRFAEHRSPYCWAYELLRSGGNQLRDLTGFGLECLPAYQHFSLRELRQQVDEEFYLLSVAHYERYFSRAPSGLLDQWLDAS